LGEISGRSDEATDRVIMMEKRDDYLLLLSKTFHLEIFLTFFKKQIFVQKNRSNPQKKTFFLKKTYEKKSRLIFNGSMIEIDSILDRKKLICKIVA
jgi:hypothetical protein